MSISHLFPEEGPTLNLNFAGSRTLDPRITFSRSQTTSNGSTYMDQNGLIVTAAADEPRFDHRYVNGEVESLGLLIEEQRSNLFPNGSTVGSVGTQPSGLNYATTPTGQSAVVSSDFDVDGNDKSIKHTRGSSGDNNVGYYSVAGLTTGVPHTFSIYVYIPSSQQSSITSIRFGPDTSYSNVEYGYADTDIVDRWQRVVGKYDPSTQISSVICRATASDGTYFYTDAWQLEEGSFPTSYIPTEGSTKTRTKDVPQMVGTNLTDWFSSTEGTFIINHRWNTLDTFVDSLFAVSTDGGVSGINLYDVTSAAYGAGLQFPGTNNFVKILSPGYYKYGLTYNTTSRATVVNGGGVVEDNNAFTSLNTVNRFSIGMDRGNNWQGSKTIAQITYYPTRLTNSQLISLTR